MTKTTYNVNAPYPFQYQTINGFKFAGFTHTLMETIGVFVDHFANSYAREILYDEPCEYSITEIIETVEYWTGATIDRMEIIAACDEKIAWYRSTYNLA